MLSLGVFDVMKLKLKFFAHILVFEADKDQKYLLFSNDFK